MARRLPMTAQEEKATNAPAISKPAFQIVTSGALAEVVEVANNQAIVQLGGAQYGKGPSNIKVGELLILEGATQAIVGEVSGLTVGDGGPGVGSRAVVTLLATLHPKTGKLVPGVTEPPSLGGKAYRPHSDVIRAVIEDRGSLIEDGRVELKLELARPLQNSDIALSFSPEKMFGRHCAVLGTSGAGKSWSVGRLIEQIAKHKSKVILLDPTGEYEPLDHRVFHVHLGKSHRPDVKSLEAALPYRDLTESDLIAIFKPTNGSQVLKLRAAIKTLKLVELEPKLAAEGTVIKQHKPKLIFEEALKSYKEEIDQPQNKFDILKLPLQIDFECIEPIRSQAETTCWGGINNHDQSACVSLINRINDILGMEELKCIFKSSKLPSIFDVIDRFLKDPDVSVLRISFEFLPSSHRVREIIANSLGRFLLQKGRSKKFVEQPMIVFLDEAHQSLNTQLSDMSNEFPLEAFNIIAKEGRKYGLTMCLATQRPRDIPDDVLSQVGTFIVHRLVNDGDRSTIERASGTASQLLLDNLPALGPGESFFMGIDFPTPLRVRMIKPERPPKSAGPNYQKYWTDAG
jgi:DNA helicase HerA-like ATPase